MSSVSFGKSYLCITDVGTGLQYKKNKWETGKYIEKRFMVKTNHENKFLTSLTYFGEDTNYCNPDDSRVKQHSDGGIIKCNFQDGFLGFTMMEFTIDKVEKKFQVYFSGMFSKSDSKRSKRLSGHLKRIYKDKFDTESSYIFIGKCSEV